ncbi:MAG: four helix bundle protein [Crocinitomicaceae bacterium]|nr:four helix bundle protein [Crocinitomicaceae bacterium]
MKENILKTKSFQFAIDSVNLYKELVIDKEFVMSKQFLRSSTSVGANIRESCNSNSKKDFVYKLSISQKECDESIYWLELMERTGYIEARRMEPIKNQGEEILRIIKSSILTAKRNLNK